MKRKPSSPDDHKFDRGVHGGVPVLKDERGRPVTPRNDEKYKYQEPAEWPSIDTDESRGGKNQKPLVRNE